MIEILNPDDPEPEPLDLVNERDEVVGHTHQSLVYEGFNHLLAGFFARQADVFLLNDAGQLWTPTRAPDKRLAPDGLDFAAAEHVQRHESYRAAAVRGVAEELGMTIAPTDLELLGKLTPADGGTLYFSEIFLLRHNEAPANFSRKDYVSWQWHEPSHLLHILASGAKAKRTLEPAIRLLLAYQAQHEGNEQWNQQVVQPAHSQIL